MKAEGTATGKEVTGFQRSAVTNFYLREFWVLLSGANHTGQILDMMKKTDRNNADEN